MNTENKIESILLFKNEPVGFKELSKILNISIEEVQTAVSNLQQHYENRGIVLVTDGEEVSLGTHASLSGLIEEMQKDELSRELGKAGLETLSIVLYKHPISRREIDYIRGVNSSFILRNLLIRGLIERTEGIAGERSYTYKPTLELLRHLGLTKTSDLPGYEDALAKMLEFTERENGESSNE